MAKYVKTKIDGNEAGHEYNAGKDGLLNIGITDNELVVRVNGEVIFRGDQSNFYIDKNFQITDTQWEDLRVSVNTTTSAGSNPPIEAILANDGGEISGPVNALSFLSVSDGILTLPDNAAYDTSADFTFEFWVRPVVGTQQLECVGKSGVFALDFRNDNTFRLNPVGEGAENGTVQFTRGDWNHVAIVHDDSEDQLYLYVNGQLDITISIASVVDNTEDIIFNNNKTLFDLDYIAYWDTPLNASEIATRYASGAGLDLVGNETNLVALWELNDGSGTTVDETVIGAAADGTISGGSEDTEWEWIGGHVGGTGDGSRGVLLRYFSPDEVNEVYFEIQMPHSWKAGTDIRPHVHWVPAEDGTGTQDVKWGLEYTWANIGETFGTTSFVYGDTNYLAETLEQGKHCITNMTHISGTGKGFSSMLACRLFRDATDAADDFTGFAGLLEFDLHYEKRSFGTDEEYSN
jgi:hypothetical protein